MGPVTTNPWLVAAINMTIVFSVLIVLGVMMHLLAVIDPTKKKDVAKAPAPKAAAPVAAPAAPAVKDNSEEIAAVIAAAVAASGCSADDVAVVRIARNGGAWRMSARAEAQSVKPF